MGANLICTVVSVVPVTRSRSAATAVPATPIKPTGAPRPEFEELVSAAAEPATSEKATNTPSVVIAAFCFTVNMTISFG
jgi:hypothetical protein